MTHTDRRNTVSTSSSFGSLLSKNEDVIKRGSLYVKRPPCNNPVKFRLKTWQKRYLVLRDNWSENGDTVLELYSDENNANTSSSSSSVVDNHNTTTTTTTTKTTSMFKHCSSINLRSVIYVDVYTDSRTFQHAFIVLRAAKSPLIFGAKTDLEMREWMMAIKLLSDKVSRLSRTTAAAVEDSGASNATGSQAPVCHHRSSEVRPPPKIENRSTLRRDDRIHRSTPQLLNCSSVPNGVNKKNVKILRLPPTAAELLNHNNNSSASVDCESKFLVVVKKSEDSNLHRLNGEYHLIVNDTEICLRRSSTTDNIITWPLQHIRKLKSEATNDGQGDLITLVASSQCGPGQGTYYFRITSGWDLIRRVRMLAKKIDSDSTSNGRRQITERGNDVIKIKSIVSSSLDKLLSISTPDGDDAAFNQSMQSLSMSSRNSSSSGSQLERISQSSESYTITTSSQSHVYFATGNAYLPIVDDDDTVTMALPKEEEAADELRPMTLSRSMGSLGLLPTTSRRIDSGFESSEEAGKEGHSPPVPPPRPVHTIIVHST